MSSLLPPAVLTYSALFNICLTTLSARFSGYMQPSTEETLATHNQSSLSNMKTTEHSRLSPPTNPSSQTVSEPRSNAKHVADLQNAYDTALHAVVSAEDLGQDGLVLFTNSMEGMAIPLSWKSNPRLHYIVARTNRLDLLSTILDAGVTDLWLPLHSRLVRRWFNAEESKSFIRFQNFILDDNIPIDPQGRHFSLDNLDELDLAMVKFLGDGGFGEVHHVQNRRNGQAYACKTMPRPVKYDLHVKLMQNFKREITGMRRVRHQHCVDLVASCTDIDSVTILSSPVADGDLAHFMAADLDDTQHGVLRNAIGCITSALAYLHSLKIRHGDLKPSNILLHGTNVLLTDFGFCLDSSDTGVTTTAGPPSHYTRRYAAPEVFDHAPRNRLTDIWSLGCVLVDIISRLFGHTLDRLKKFWLSHGANYDSYAQNPEATDEWLTFLTASCTDRMWRWLLSFIRFIVLEEDRSKRPTAEQILQCLRTLNKSQALPQSLLLIGHCCMQDPEVDEPEAAPRKLQKLIAKINHPTVTFPALDLYGVDNDVEAIFFDPDSYSILASTDDEILGTDMRSSLGGAKDFIKLQNTVNLLISAYRLTECSVETRHTPKRDSDMYIKSLYMCCSGLGNSATVLLGFRDQSGALRLYKVHLLFAAMQFESERNKPATPFIAMVSDPDEVPMVTPENNTFERREILTSHPMAQYMPVYGQCHSCEEHRSWELAEPSEWDACFLWHSFGHCEPDFSLLFAQLDQEATNKDRAIFPE